MVAFAMLIGCRAFMARCAVALATAFSMALPVAAQQAVDTELLARGAYLSKAADCAGCHTARIGGAPFAGGFSMSSPFGVIISTNITPDPEHGIGRYSYDDFARVLRVGVAPGNKHLYPAMPYTAFAKLTDDDIHALYGYMMNGVAAVAVTPPPTRVPFPFNQRWLLGAWQALFVPKGVYQPIDGKDRLWNRGAYLVQSLGHCGSCHTPRGYAYQEKGYDESSAHFLTGEVNDDWFAPSLRNSPGSGIGRIGEQDLVSFMKTGHGAGVAAYGTMVDTIQTSLQYLSAEDLQAIARYLKALPAQEDPASYHPDEAAVAERTAAEGNRTLDVESGGAAVYKGFCLQCHQSDGRGIPKLYPALAGNPSVLTKDSTSLVRLVLQGGSTPETQTGPPPQSMPAFGATLSDLQIAQVLTYLRDAWGNDADPVSANDVAGIRKRLDNR
jgi:mono/diheme cytochrome c family protein